VENLEKKIWKENLDTHQENKVLIDSNGANDLNGNYPAVLQGFVK